MLKDISITSVYCKTFALFYWNFVTLICFQGVGELPSESHSAKGGNGHGSRHSTGGPIRVPNQSRNSHRQMEHHDGSPSSYGHPSPSSVSPKNSSLKSRKQHSYVSQESAGNVVVPVVHEAQLPEGLLERLKASNWNERHEAISELEAFVSARPAAMAPHLHKVNFINRSLVICSILVTRHCVINTFNVYVLALALSPSLSLSLIHSLYTNRYLMSSVRDSQTETAKWICMPFKHSATWFLFFAILSFLWPTT